MSEPTYKNVWTYKGGVIAEREKQFLFSYISQQGNQYAKTIAIPPDDIRTDEGGNSYSQTFGDCIRGLDEVMTIYGFQENAPLVFEESLVDSISLSNFHKYKLGVEGQECKPDKEGTAKLHPDFNPVACVEISGYSHEELAKLKTEYYVKPPSTFSLSTMQLNVAEVTSLNDIPEGKIERDENGLILGQEIKWPEGADIPKLEPLNPDQDHPSNAMVTGISDESLNKWPKPDNWGIIIANPGKEFININVGEFEDILGKFPNQLIAEKAIEKLKDSGTLGQGYPCSVTCGNKKIICEDEEGLKLALVEFLEVPNGCNIIVSPKGTVVFGSVSFNGEIQAPKGTTPHLKPSDFLEKLYSMREATNVPVVTNPDGSSKIDLGGNVISSATRLEYLKSFTTEQIVELSGMNAARQSDFNRRIDTELKKVTTGHPPTLKQIIELLENQKELTSEFLGVLNKTMTEIGKTEPSKPRWDDGGKVTNFDSSVVIQTGTPQPPSLKGVLFCSEEFAFYVAQKYHEVYREKHAILPAWEDCNQSYRDLQLELFCKVAKWIVEAYPEKKYLNGFVNVKESLNKCLSFLKEINGAWATDEDGRDRNEIDTSSLISMIEESEAYLFGMTYDEEKLSGEFSFELVDIQKGTSQPELDWAKRHELLERVKNPDKTNWPESDPVPPNALTVHSVIVERNEFLIKVLEEIVPLNGVAGINLSPLIRSIDQVLARECN